MESELPKKPRWEYGGTFDAAWAGARFLIEANKANLEGTTEEMKTHLDAVISALSRAHVVTLEREQYEALPLDLEGISHYMPDPHLPFPTIYVSVGAPLLAGVLYQSDQEQVAAIPFIGWEQGNNAPANQHQRITISMPVALIDATGKEYTDWMENLLPGEALDEHDSGSLVYPVERSLSVLRFLESANVDFEDTPVSRQVRRQAQRKGTPISQRVYVRSPRYRQKNGQTEHGHIDYSHRFEVRGHYKHFGPDTRLFRATERDRPHKIIEHPKMGPMVRIWCPDFVKGPEDKPLVPKTRVYKKEVA